MPDDDGRRRPLGSLHVLELQQLHRRQLRALPPRVQGVFALLCAERLVRASPERVDELVPYLEAGWAVVRGSDADGLGRLRALRAELEERHGREDGSTVVDDAATAVTCLALGAVLGDGEDAVQVASRALDAAFDRIGDAHGRSTVEQLSRDARSTPVGQELTHQRRAVVSLKVHGPTEAVIESLRE